jgi:hypothetical protein
MSVLRIHCSFEQFSRPGTGDIAKQLGPFSPLNSRQTFVKKR